MLEKAGILAVPGDVYGAGGEKCIRMSFATTMEEIVECVKRMKQIFA